VALVSSPHNLKLAITVAKDGSCPESRESHEGPFFYFDDNGNDFLSYPGR
jgi:hypothetical protein